MVSQANGYLHFQEMSLCLVMHFTVEFVTWMCVFKQVWSSKRVCKGSRAALWAHIIRTLTLLVTDTRRTQRGWILPATFIFTTWTTWCCHFTLLQSSSSCKGSKNSSPKISSDFRPITTLSALSEVSCKGCSSANFCTFNQK